MNETATRRMRRCHGVRSGQLERCAASSTLCSSQSPKPRICAAENAASARVAVSFGSSSSASCPAGWFVRSPRRRATTSVPKRLGGASPAAFVPWRRRGFGTKTECCDQRRVELRHRHRCCRIGGAAAGRSRRPAARSASAACVSGASGWKDAALPPISPRGVTARISRCAHDVFCDAAHGGRRERQAERASGGRAAASPGESAFAAEPLGCGAWTMEITPEPTEDERRAILAALAAAEAAPRRLHEPVARGRARGSRRRRACGAGRERRGRSRALRPTSGRPRRAAPTTRRGPTRGPRRRSRRQPPRPPATSLQFAEVARLDDDAALERGEAEARDEELARDDRDDHPRGKDVLVDQLMSTESTSSLSATGSRSLPSEDVWPRRRAIRPSSQSVPSRR